VVPGVDGLGDELGVRCQTRVAAFLVKAGGLVAQEQDGFVLYVEMSVIVIIELGRRGTVAGEYDGSCDLLRCRKTEGNKIPIQLQCLLGASIRDLQTVVFL